MFPEMDQKLKVINYSFVGPDATNCSFYRAILWNSKFSMVKDVNETKDWQKPKIFPQNRQETWETAQSGAFEQRWFVAKIKKTLRDYKVTNPSAKQIIMMKNKLEIGVLIIYQNFPSMKIVLNIFSKKIL